jgi:hypothetical protein
MSELGRGKGEEVLNVLAVRQEVVHALLLAAFAGW